MAKLVLLLVFVCFQFSSQEDLGKAEIELGKPQIELGKPEIQPGNHENELVKPEIPTNDTQLLDGADKNQWQPEKDDEEWTEEDEKWLQEILELLEESDEDYDDDLNSDEFDELMEELDKYFGESDESDEDSDEWYKGDDDWDIDLNHYPDYFDSQKETNKINDYLDLYYSWLYKLQINNPNGRRQVYKRFTSV